MKNKSEREVTGMIDFKNSEYVKMKEIDPGSTVNQWRGGHRFL